MVRGRKDGQDVEEVLDCHVPGMPKWSMGVDVDTGCPPSIAMQLLLAGDITARGAIPAEVAIPPEPFFRELANPSRSFQVFMRPGRGVMRPP